MMPGPGLGMPNNGMNPYMTGFPGGGMINPMTNGMPPPQMNMGMPFMNTFATAMPGGMPPNNNMGMGMPPMGQ